MLLVPQNGVHYIEVLAIFVPYKEVFVGDYDCDSIRFEDDDRKCVDTIECDDGN